MVEGINHAIQELKGAEGGQISISMPAHILDRVKVIVNGGNRAATIVRSCVTVSSTSVRLRRRGDLFTNAVRKPDKYSAPMMVNSLKSLGTCPGGPVPG